MEQIKISKAGTADVETVRAIGRETFFESFAKDNTEADMKKYLDENFSAEKIAAELGHPGSIFYVVWDGQKPVGYLKVNTEQAQTDLQEKDSLEIERIYILRAYQGKKVGQLLYEKALEVALDLHKTSIWLGVWEQNSRAIKFYFNNGFRAFDKHVFKVGEDEQMDFLMRKRLEV
jgi:ribosomal protein S18 acetylase RimI-like enzyme